MTPYQTFGAPMAQGAVSNMQFPTAAYLQSAQNAAEIEARGKEAMGKGIASGISSAVGGYMKYKETKAEVGAAEKSYDFFKNYLSEETRNKIDSAVERVNSDPNMSLMDKKAFWEKTNGILGAVVNQAMSLEKSGQEQQAAMDRLREGEAAAAYRQQQQIKAKQDAIWREGSVRSTFDGGAGVGGSGVFQPQPMQINQPQAAQSSLNQQFMNQFGRK